MLEFLGTAAFSIAALTSAPNAAAPVVAQAAAVTTPVVASAPARRGRHQQQAVSTQPSTQSIEDQVFEDQARLRVFMPAFSGDGGG